MGFLRKLFPSRKKSKDEILAELRATINRFTLISRQYYNRAVDSRDNAKKCLRQGDVETARSQLKRWSKYIARFKRYQQQVDILEDTIESIHSAEDAATMHKALESANILLSKSVEFLTMDKAIETRMETQDLINEIEAKQEELSRALEIGVEDESFIDRELEKLQNEVAVEAAASLPETPSETPLELSERDRIKKEVEELKKALSEENLEEKE